MTAEIAVMNKIAIALAADSAVTIHRGYGRKIFNSVHKLFMLSKYHPVGIMIYGSAELLGIPWETTIKLYREELNEYKFDTLKEYANNFINFLENNNLLFSKHNQEKFLEIITYNYFFRIKRMIDQNVEESFKNGQLTVEQLKSIIDKIIDKEYEKINRNFELIQDRKARSEYIKNFKEKYFKLISKISKNIFQQLPVDRKRKEKLKKIILHIFLKDIIADTGVVIAGFGEKEYFPGVVEIKIHNYINNKLIYFIKEPINVSLENQAIIIPFAQSEMVNTFIEGINPYLYLNMRNYIFKAFLKEFPERFIELLNFDEKLKEDILRRYKDLTRTLLKKMLYTFDNQRKEIFIDPILSIVASLPKDELASLAESLVNLTSLKRKFSMDEETVGGPIDVALISKGDGFIWIKRKHYFEPDLNHNYFLRQIKYLK